MERGSSSSRRHWWRDFRARPHPPCARTRRAWRGKCPASAPRPEVGPARPPDARPGSRRPRAHRCGRSWHQACRRSARTHGSPKEMRSPGGASGRANTPETGRDKTRCPRRTGRLSRHRPVWGARHWPRRYPKPECRGPKGQHRQRKTTRASPTASAGRPSLRRSWSRSIPQVRPTKPTKILWSA